MGSGAAVCLRRLSADSSTNSRVEAVVRLQNRQWSGSLCRAIAARLDGLIVDEAQDCKPLDLQLLAWLREHGLRVTIVSDTDQAIRH